MSSDFAMTKILHFEALSIDSSASHGSFQRFYSCLFFFFYRKVRLSKVSINIIFRLILYLN